VTRIPSAKTLAKYGLAEAEFVAMAEAQAGACRVCENEPRNGRLCIDHLHVRGWKAMPPEQRKLYVRGLLCFFCNHYYVGRAITVRKARNVVDYLEDFEARLKAATG
jgi:hypothetical protein